MVNLLKEMTQEEISQFVSHWKEGTLLKYRKEILNSDNHDNNMFTEEKYSKIFTTALKEKWGKEENEWSFPKGKIEFKENKLTCALRELKEETGIKACDIWTCNKGVVFTNKCRNYDYELNIFPALTFNDFSFSYENNIEVGNIAWFDLAGITKKVFIKASELQELLKLFPWKKNDSLEDKKI
jgi:8-oxo-dGTP pyrophosphatase MutT (NUDIX family)